MKMISTVALAAMLASGIGSVALVAPAAAAKKEEKKAGPKLSPAFLKIAQVAQPAIAAKDLATAEPAVVQLESSAANDDEKYIATALRYDLEQQKMAAAQAANPNAPVNETALAAPLDALLANPSTPAENKGRYAYRRGVLAYNGKQYPQAVQYFTQAQQLGFTDPNLGLQIMKARVEGGDTKAGLVDLQKYVEQQNAAGQKAPEEYYRYAIARANAAKLKPETLAWIQRYAAAYPSPKTWRDVVYTFGVAQNSMNPTLDKSQKLDLFRLLRASNALADPFDFLEYAQYARDKGLPAEAVAVLQEGISSGKIPASNTTAKSQLADAQQLQRNEGSLAAQETKARAGSGQLAASIADVYYGTKNYAKAADLYRLALSKGGANAEEVNTHLGMALAQSGDKAGAQAAFAAVKTQPRADIASLWTTWMQLPTA